MFELQQAEYESRFHVRFLADKLGDGKDGLVLLHERLNAVKFLHERENYKRELRAYRVLRDADIDQIYGHQVPRLIQADDHLLAIEMTVVAPPFLLDFVSTYNDEELAWLGFDSTVLAEREIHWAEIFGERWPHVAAMREEFHRLSGLHLLDLSTNNIRFA